MVSINKFAYGLTLKKAIDHLLGASVGVTCYFFLNKLRVIFDTSLCQLSAKTCNSLHHLNFFDILDIPLSLCSDKVDSR